MKHYGDLSDEECARRELPRGTRTSIHGSGTIDIQTDKEGKILRVWFRCLNLPFRVSIVDDHAEYNPDTRITAVEYEGEHQ